MKRIAIFGSTGSIGSQALEVISAHPELFSVEVLTCNSNHELLVEQALKHNPNIVVITDESKYAEVKKAPVGRVTALRWGSGQHVGNVGK